MKLYHYVHCPFCSRVRMGFGLLKISYESIPVAFNDEKTPMDLTGVKMLPIVVYDNGVAQNESLDILKKVDTKNELHWDMHSAAVEDLVKRMSNPVHSLCMPYWIWTPEFDAESRNYFQKKKEQKRGPFKNLIKNKQSFIDQINTILKAEVENELKPFYKSDKLTIADIMIASQLWGMYIFPEFQFSEKVHAYLQRIRVETHFDYHEDFWN